MIELFYNFCLFVSVGFGESISLGRTEYRAIAARRNGKEYDGIAGENPSFGGAAKCESCSTGDTTKQAEAIN